MVDFRSKRLQAAKAHPPTIDPIEIFRRMPKPVGINDLYTSQAEVLRTWFENRLQRDLVIKLHTGGGKTLVGLLIAQSIMNETHSPVIYLSPTSQLVEQILEKAKEYNISAVPYDKGTPGLFPNDFHNGKSVLVCAYQALFNGHSRFGIRGGRKEILLPAGIILDDAHVAFSTMRDSFTLRICKDENLEEYSYLVNLFRNDFKDMGKSGTFEDITKLETTKSDNGVLEVPYWSWKVKSAQVREYLRDIGEKESYTYVWHFLRDDFDYCHCFISAEAFVITSIFPMVDIIPSFADCPRRIYMSATIGNDSALIRTFDTSPQAVAKPITSKSLAGVSERMILVPELMKIPKEDIPRILRKLVKSLSEEKNMGIVILVPSFNAGDGWKEVATVVQKAKVSTVVKNLQDEASYGPFVFASRYDGIDLPGNSCRMLIMAGSPSGKNEYDMYRADIFADSAVITSELAQRIEQGIGRGARGASDYCVVIMTGADLVERITRRSSQTFLTSSTLAQLGIGLDNSKDITDEEGLKKTILACLERDRDWIEYHADRLASLTIPPRLDKDQLRFAYAERRAFKLMREGLFEDAIACLKKYYENTDDLDLRSKGWFQQFVARIAFYWGNHDLSQKYQQQAYSNNSHLLRSLVVPPYIPLPTPSQQSEEIVSKILNHQIRQGFLSEFERIVSQLGSHASTNNFEQSLMELGTILGFQAERPEKKYERGPDVLWLLDNSIGLVIEAKSQKAPKNPLTKDEHGQLLNSVVWFKEQYPSYECIGVSVHPNALATKHTSIGTSKALTLHKLKELVAEAYSLFEMLCSSSLSREALILRCEKFLESSHLKPQLLIEYYLQPFKVPSE